MVEPGLCGSCRNARTIGTRKGSTFILCELAGRDPRLRKYPMLPVRSCPGYEEAPGEASGEAPGRSPGD